MHNNKKYACTIIISHFESLVFLRACVRSIRKYKNERVFYHILVADQSGDKTHNDVINEFNQEDIEIIRMSPLYSGYGLDYIFRNKTIITDYICQVHVDVVAISDKFLLMPITLIEENNLAFVGQLQCINSKDNLANIYPPSPFFAMAQCYNVAKTSTYRELSMIPGFTRFHNRPQAEIEWASSDWSNWAKEDYQARGSDDDIVAFSWEDRHRQHDKLGLAITGFIEPSFGRIIEECVFHFGSHREALTVLNQMPKMYSHYLNRINENYSDELIDEMVNLAKTNLPPEIYPLDRNYWNGKTKEHYPPSEELNEKINQLKK